MEDDQLDAPVRIVMSKGDFEDHRQLMMIQNGTASFSVSRPNAAPSRVVISIEADASIGDGLTITVSEPIARKLVADLSAVLADPESRGATDRELDDA